VIVAIASGKGGTGKTTVAVNLALSMSADVQLLDCDVEAPNAHLFLRPRIDSSDTAGIPVPIVDPERCNGCGECSQLCQYNAIVTLRSGAMVFPELCHGCGGCIRVCPEGAISEKLRPIGVVEQGRTGRVRLLQGRLNVGESLAPPLIRAVRSHAASGTVVLIDAPPGTSCPMISAVRGCDLVILVTEPTPFGLNDLALAVEAVRALGIPCGVVVNRTGTGDHRVHEYCAAQGLEIMLEIPDDRRIAEAYARGLTLVEAVPEIRPLFAGLAARIEAMATMKSVRSVQEDGVHASLRVPV
jgi:MinD superfamily P-loop ATPase